MYCLERVMLRLERFNKAGLVYLRGVFFLVLVLDA